MKNKKLSAVLHLVLLIAVLTLVTMLTLHFMPQATVLFRDPAKFRQHLLSYGSWSILVFIGLQVLQVVVAFLPGEVVQVAGGYIYGVFMGTIYSLIGILLGSFLIFFLARFLGYPMLRVFVSRQQLQRFDFLLNSKQAEMITFLLFLLPGAPKDVLTYIAGITPMRSGNFFLVAMLGRFPGILVSSLIGAQLEKQQYLLSGIFAGLATLLFLLGFLYRERIMDLLARKHQP
ncbi:MAG TPA: TVP38/TMEM64 family protein [Syntrophomonadaceae bacterium]|nr:TVP38/TMEM64 family protein [Syntrophomonadaceae bacterium]